MISVMSTIGLDWWLCPIWSQRVFTWDSFFTLIVYFPAQPHAGVPAEMPPKSKRKSDYHVRFLRDENWGWMHQHPLTPPWAKKVSNPKNLSRQKFMLARADRQPTAATCLPGWRQRFENCCVIAPAFRGIRQDGSRVEGAFVVNRLGQLAMGVIPGHQAGSMPMFLKGVPKMSRSRLHILACGSRESAFPLAGSSRPGCDAAMCSMI